MTERELTDKLAEALEEANALATAWAGYYASSPTYGQGGKVHGRHAKILKKARKALDQYRQARAANHSPDAGNMVADHIVDANKKDYPCPQCDGEGEMKVGECPACKGRGWIPIPEGSSVCEQCEGGGDAIKPE